jgi:hypothetical protein
MHTSHTCGTYIYTYVIHQVSDCDALSDGASHRYIQTHFNGSLQVQAQQALRGGTDLNCGALYGEQVSGLLVQQVSLVHTNTDYSLPTFYTWVLITRMLRR